MNYEKLHNLQNIRKLQNLLGEKNVNYVIYKKYVNSVIYKKNYKLRYSAHLCIRMYVIRVIIFYVSIKEIFVGESSPQ